MSKASEARLRLFFALPLPDELCRRLDAWRHDLGIAGQLIAPADLHLTLAFLGNQPPGSLPALLQLAGELHAQPFELSLEQLRCWHGGLLHLAPRQIPTALLGLQRQLHQALDQGGWPTDARPYRPHLTLARHSQLPARSEPCAFAWQVEHFALFASQPQSDGRRYCRLAQWLLQAHGH